MIGMKRPYPFSMETPPAPTFHFKYPPCYVAPMSRLDEPASCSNRCNANNEPGFSVIRSTLFFYIISFIWTRRRFTCTMCWRYFWIHLREGPLRPSTLSKPIRAEVRIRENGSLNGDFLTLAPPVADSPHLVSQHKHSLANSGPQSLSEFGSQPSQVRNQKNKIFDVVASF